MFTGIVEEIGIVKEFKQSVNNALVVVECNKVLQDTKIGDSISINGVCQTVVAIENKVFSAQISAQTLAVTNLSELKSGVNVNLERALTLVQRLGGHIVTGHIDSLAKIVRVEKLSDFYNVWLAVEKDYAKYVVNKGSVAVNGISLTIADVRNNEFMVAVIPHTYKNTNLVELKSGDFVNIEFDILAKYVEKFLLTNNNSVIDEDFLKENGFF